MCIYIYIYIYIIITQINKQTKKQTYNRKHITNSTIIIQLKNGGNHTKNKKTQNQQHNKEANKKKQTN